MIFPNDLLSLVIYQNIKLFIFRWEIMSTRW